MRHLAAHSQGVHGSGSTSDDASQLTALTYKRSGTTIGDLAYSYDGAGRRATTAGSYARLDLPAAVSSAVYNVNNQLTTWAGTTISYDNNGNMLGDGVNTYSWNARDQLAAVTKTGQTLPAFTYDAFGRRQKKTLGATVTSYLYDGANTVQELTGTSVSANMLTGLGVDELFQRADTAATRTVLSDALGSTVALADTSGVVQTSYNYAPYGATTSSGGTSSNTSQFTGRENDADSLYFYRARYYHPVFGRFVSEDPIGFGAGNTGLYGYVHESPTNLTDPSGQFVPWIAACAVGAGSALAVDFVVFLMAGGRKENAPSHASLLGSAASGCISSVIGFGIFRAVRPLINRLQLFRAVGPRELDAIRSSGNYGSGPNLAGKYFARTEEGVTRFATSSFNAGRNMTVTSVDVPRWISYLGHSFNDPGPGGAGASIHFAERWLPVLYRFMSSIRIMGAP